MKLNKCEAQLRCKHHWSDETKCKYFTERKKATSANCESKCEYQFYIYCECKKAVQQELKRLIRIVDKKKGEKL